MKIAVVFISLFLLFKPLLPLLEYAAFYDFIKSELCENKEKVEMKCNGKCYLTKQLAKVAESEKGNEKNQPFIVELSIVFYQDTNLNYAFLLLEEPNLKIEHSYKKNYKFQYTNSIFHPPTV